MANGSDYNTNRLQKLIGGRITKIAIDSKSFPGEEFYGLVIQFPKGNHKIVFFLRDDEGNGPGSFEIQDAK